jgi:hypothetical protein
MVELKIRNQVALSVRANLRKKAEAANRREQQTIGGLSNVHTLAHHFHLAQKDTRDRCVVVEE